MSPRIRLTLIIAAVALGPVLIAGAAFGTDRLVHHNTVLRNVAAGGADLAGLPRAEALETLRAHEDELATIPVPVALNGGLVELDPLLVGFDVDEGAAADAAFEVGRTGGVGSQFSWWFRHLFTDDQIPLPVALDPVALEEVLTQWDAEYVDDPPFEGAVELNGDEPVPSYPLAGRRIAREGAAQALLSSLADRARPTIQLQLEVAEPVLSAEHIDAAVRQAERLLAGPITLTRDDPDVSVTFDVGDLARAFTTQFISEPSVGLTVGFDPDVVERLLAPLRASLEAPPRDAELIITEEDTVQILPGRSGTLVDAALAASAMRQASKSIARTGQMPFEEGAEPEVTTEDVEALGINHLVSQFTTYHACCQDRVTNIQLMADTISGAVVLPGETFSINEYVGERTRDKGYKPAGTIIEGELQDTVGGGVSQFATTFYNAVFWGGYEDVTHTPHSFYFSRYPEGIEGTINWPSLHLVFRNDDDEAVYIRTKYTSTSITVQFFGDNGGRTVIGEQTRGRTNIEVVSDGSGARALEAHVSGRHSFTDPSIKYAASDEILPGAELQVEDGVRGWSVTVTRTLTYPDGTQTEEKWVVRYRSQPILIERHSCELPEDHPDYTGPECPVPETTTLPTTTTAAV